MSLSKETYDYYVLKQIRTLMNYLGEKEGEKPTLTIGEPGDVTSLNKKLKGDSINLVTSDQINLYFGGWDNFFNIKGNVTEIGLETDEIGAYAPYSCSEIIDARQSIELPQFVLASMFCGKLDMRTCKQMSKEELEKLRTGSKFRNDRRNVVKDISPLVERSSCIGWNTFGNIIMANESPLNMNLALQVINITKNIRPNINIWIAERALGTMMEDDLLAEEKLETIKRETGESAIYSCDGRAKVYRIF